MGHLQASDEDAVKVSVVKVSVTQLDIDEGSKAVQLSSRCFCCPVALAMSRAFGERVSVSGWSWCFERRGNSEMLPESVAKRIKVFDSVGVMSPFEFEV